MTRRCLSMASWTIEPGWGEAITAMSCRFAFEEKSAIQSSPPWTRNGLSLLCGYSRNLQSYCCNLLPRLVRHKPHLPKQTDDDQRSGCPAVTIRRKTWNIGPPWRKVSAFPSDTMSFQYVIYFYKKTFWRVRVEQPKETVVRQCIPGQD